MRRFSFFLLLVFCLVRPVLAQDQRARDHLLSPALKRLIQNGRSGDSIALTITYKQAIPSQINSRFRILSSYQSVPTIKVRLSVSQVDLILEDTTILFVDRDRVPVEEISTGAVDYTANRITTVHNNWPHLNGNNISVSVKEQRFDTTDIDFAGRHFNSGIGAPGITSHASIMATIIGGGGNSSEHAKGVAWGSLLTSSSFLNLMPDTDSIYRAKSISVQNHSYGTGIENFYGADAAAYDLVVYHNPSLVHVFSAGNAGTSIPDAGIYKNISNYANLTGSFKMAKNVILVGHVDSFLNVLPLSSNGPAFDGRLKPDIVAYGEDGSSGAAAIVSGFVAVLQQSYQLKYLKLPTASLVKALLLNSADDVFQNGIDYRSGFGNLNAENAISALLDNRFFESEVQNNQVKSFPIEVPGGISKLRITLAWTDTAGSVNTQKALVNDLDCRLITPSNDTVYPWVLSSYPHKDSLAAPAGRRRDSLNNIEQITVDAPVAGTYQLEVKGTSLATARQAFSVVFQLDTANHFSWIYPVSSDVLEAGANNLLRWDSKSDGNAEIEYSVNGLNWLPVGSVQLGKQYFSWQTPDLQTKVMLRMRPSGSSGNNISDTFLVSTPMRMRVGFNCADSILLYWNQVKDAQYQLYALGSRYMEAISTLSDTFKVLSKTQNHSQYFSVASLHNDRRGFRSPAFNFNNAGVACYFKSFFVSLTDTTGVISAELGTLYNVRSVEVQKIVNGTFVSIQSFASPASVSFNSEDKRLTPGINTYRMAIQLSDGNYLYGQPMDIYFFKSLPVIVFPNPAPQRSGVRIIAREPGVYAIDIYDLSGRLVFQYPLSDITNRLPPFLLRSGIYLVKVAHEDGSSFVQKLIVY